MGARPSNSDVTARAAALSPRRLATLTGLFIIALAALLVAKLQEEASSRRVETQLQVAKGATDCLSAMNISIMTGASFGETLRACHPGGASAVFHLSASRTVLGSFGQNPRLDIDDAIAGALPNQHRGETTFAFSHQKIAAAWRTLDNGDVILIAAPADDFYMRTPIWFAYALILGAITLVMVSLMSAFVRQSRAAAEAAGAIDALRETKDALRAGRCSAWRYDGARRSIVLSRSFLEPLGFGARDRSFSLQEISALTHPSDLRVALAVFTGDNADITEGQVRLRQPSGAWSSVYLRTADSDGDKRRGVAFDLGKAGVAAPQNGAGAALAETRLKDAIESIPEAFVLWDAQGRLTAWNKRFMAIFRIEKGALKPGLNAQELAASAKTGADVITQYLTPDAALDEQSVEVAMRGDHWLQISRRRTAEGGLVCVASNVTDIKRRARAQKRKERILQNAIEELEASRTDLSDTMRKYKFEKHRAEEASRSKSEFLANMSHELRTPLNAINGFSEIMKSELYGPLGNDKYKEYVSDILSSGQHLLALIDGILDMSKIEAGRIQLSLERIDLERVLQESARLIAPRAHEANVQLSVSVGNVPQIYADARAVKQVALNLLSNAVKFTEAGGEISLTAEADLDSVTVIVSDSGCGIDPHKVKRLGAPFELIEETAQASNNGAGLGIALSRSLMELQGGLLAIASEPGAGTIACAAFPRRAEAKVRLPHFVRDSAHIITSRKRPQPAAEITTEAAE